MNKNNLKIVFVIVAILVGLLIISKNYSKTEVVVQNPENQKVVYSNLQYGFSFTLPDSWKGYSVVTEEWRGFDMDSTYEKPAPTKTGPIIHIRHPAWTESVPRQDIPVMVFTLEDWNLIVSEKLSVGAAPIPPRELGRNSKHVFAIPARYNYAYPVGFEEVDEIINNSSNFKLF
jgi:hypothetical protein